MCCLDHAHAPMVSWVRLTSVRHETLSAAEGIANTIARLGDPMTARKDVESFDPIDHFCLGKHRGTLV